MISIDDVKNILKENNIYMGKVRGYMDSISTMIRCPYCGDSSKSIYKCHLQIKYKNWKGKDTLLFRCARCSESGHIFKLFERLEIPFDRKRYTTKEASEVLTNFRRPDIFSIRKVFGLKKRTLRYLNKTNIIRRVRSKEVNDTTREALKYLVKKRRYDKDYIKELLRKRQIVICDNFDVQIDPYLSPLYERVLVFSLNCILVQGRKINDFGKRYYVYRETDEYSDIIYFEGVGSTVFLTEGPFDSMRINSFGYPTISLQGKNTGNLIESYTDFARTKKAVTMFKHIIFCFDQDVPYEELENHCKKLWKSGIINNKQKVGYLKIYETEYKDIDEVLDEDEFDKIVRDKIAFFSPLDRITNIFKRFL